MNGWIWQKYANVPRTLKVCANDPLATIEPESNDPSVAVTVCGAPSSFVQVSVDPTATVSGVSNAKSEIEVLTAVGAGGAAVGATVGAVVGAAVGRAVGAAVAVGAGGAAVAAAVGVGVGVEVAAGDGVAVTAGGVAVSAAGVAVSGAGVGLAVLSVPPSEQPAAIMSTTAHTPIRNPHVTSIVPFAGRSHAVPEAGQASSLPRFDRVAARAPTGDEARAGAGLPAS